MNIEEKNEITKTFCTSNCILKPSTTSILFLSPIFTVCWTAKGCATMLYRFRIPDKKVNCLIRTNESWRRKMVSIVSAHNKPAWSETSSRSELLHKMKNVGFPKKISRVAKKPGPVSFKGKASCHTNDTFSFRLMFRFVMAVSPGR